MCVLHFSPARPKCGHMAAVLIYFWKDCRYVTLARLCKESSYLAATHEVERRRGCAGAKIGSYHKGQALCITESC